MANLESLVHVSLSENPDVLRKSVQVNATAIGHADAIQILSESYCKSPLQVQLNLSQHPDFYVGIRGLDPEKIIIEDTLISLSPTSVRAAFYVSRFADNIKRDLAIGGTLIAQQVTAPKERESLKKPFIAYYDIGIGMEVVSGIVDSLEGLRTYDAIEGIDDVVVKDVLDYYRRLPLAVINDAVEAHVARFDRENEGAGEYVPEFVIAGIRHAQALFINIFNKLNTLHL